MHNPNNVEIGMICLDADGDRCLIDRNVDHKRVEVAWCHNGHWLYEGDRVRMDELTPTGERDD